VGGVRWSLGEQSDSEGADQHRGESVQRAGAGHRRVREVAGLGGEGAGDVVDEGSPNGPEHAGHRVEKKAGAHRGQQDRLGLGPGGQGAWERPADVVDQPPGDPCHQGGKEGGGGQGVERTACGHGVGLVRGRGW